MLFINLFTMLSFAAFFASFLILGRPLEQSAEGGNKRREFMVFLGLTVQNLASISVVPVTEVKNQQAYIVKRW